MCTPDAWRAELLEPADAVAAAIMPLVQSTLTRKQANTALEEVVQALKARTADPLDPADAKPVLLHLRSFAVSHATWRLRGWTRCPWRPCCPFPDSDLRSAMRLRLGLLRYFARPSG